MLKVVGAALLLSGCAGIGFSAVNQLNKRVNSLRSLTEALNFMEKELVFRMPPVRELFLTTAQRTASPASEFLHECAKWIGMCEGRLVSDIWNRTAEKTLRGLKFCDREVLNTVGSVLGRYDVDGQRNAIDAAREQLKKHLSEAVEERSRQGKVYGTLGVTAGAFLVIVLL